VADRVVYRGRATPYEALTTFSHRVADTYGSEDVLPRMATILLETTRARTAIVWLRVGDRFRVAACTGEVPAITDVEAAGDEPPSLPGDHVALVRHQGELLGALGVEMPANDPLDRSRERLVDDLAAQAGAVLRNVRLIEDLRASRQRLVAAQDHERRKLERNIHDGAQQQLVALTVKARLARRLASGDPHKVEEFLAQIEQETQQALEDLRDLARGIYPPLLADKGLGAALEAQARKVTVPTTVDAHGVGRFAPDVEATVYFCTLEALQNVTKYAQASQVEVSLRSTDDLVTFAIADDGRGFDPGAISLGTGLQGMADRIEAIGGTVAIESTPGAGTTVRGRIPARMPVVVPS
jgi:signal transduction histidine kinase